MRGVSESMAGRAAILQLLPLSLAETSRVNMLVGGYPEAMARPKGRDSESDGSGWSARSFRPDGERVAERVGDHGTDSIGAALLRKLRETTHQVAQGVPDGPGSGVLSPRNQDTGGIESFAVPGCSL